jgi:AbrB family looped-hinge helix DNA binding protein
MTRKIVVGMSLVSRRGQITIPRDLRRKFGIKEGDKVFFILESDGEEKIVITKGPIILE